ncbi:MAG: isoleucine--tRNA ligase [Planctomycetota bacterium]|jgi:isoleucyl-tRNA synthetase|nr:isoleucine--tRNA ligase [Planctomycetota bacterium]
MSGSSTTGRFAPLAEGATRAPDEAERAVLERWREREVFRSVAAARAEGEVFVFWEGPPTANGRPGIHHVMARTIKDAICRYQTMRGRRVERKAGWDTHGLPVELEVEKALGISGRPEIEAYGVGPFNERCRESVWTYRREWEQLSERIAYWLDYDDPYVTYDADYVESVWHILARFHDAGLVYRGQRVVPYCGRCGTGLSSHEIGQPGVYQDVEDPSVTLRFRLAEQAGGEPESLLAWTTTPWTLPSNFALAVHPAHEYVRARVPLGEDGGSEIVWVVAERAATVLGESFEELERRRGSELAGTAYEPLFELGEPFLLPPSESVDHQARHRVVLADYVTTEDGTGIVHQAPYGADDWALATRLGIPTVLGVGPHGRFVRPVGPVEEGTPFKEADAPLTADLERRGLLFASARATHSYPHCWRCDTPLYYFPTPAWYVRTTAYKQRMIDYNRRCNWVPPQVGEGRFGDWLENNIDWNISRDRFWGTPLPFWVCEGCDAERAVGSVADLERLAGTLPEGFDNHKPLIDEVTIGCEACGATMRRTHAVVDCWFDSGAMPYAQYHWPFGDSRALVREQFPASAIAEGLDQTRGWFYSLLAIGAFLAEEDEDLEPGLVYRNCIVNGLVLDKDGVKMSKRLGNIVDPWEAIAEHGADALRWTMLAAGSPWLPRRFDPDAVLEVRRRFFGTLANSYRFFAEYARIDGFDPEDVRIPPAAERSEIDRWLLSRAQTLIATVVECMDAFDLTGTCRAVETFVVDELSNWYIRRNRRRFWKGETGADKLAAFASLHEALRSAVLVTAPIAPFLAEQLWACLAGDGSSVHGELIESAGGSRVDVELEASMAVVVRVVEMGRALRERAGARTRQPLRGIHVRCCDPDDLELLRGAFASAQVFDELNVKGWASLEMDDGELCTLRAKPEFRTLGKRLGPLMKAAGGVIAALPAEDVARLRDGGEVEIEVEGRLVTLGPGDVRPTVEVHAPFDVETDGRFVCALDLELDEDLVAEGLAREAVSRVNGLRRESGLALEQRIHLRLWGEGEGISKALSAHAELIGAETLAAELSTAAEALDGTVWAEWTVGEGEVLRASLVAAEPRS